MSFEKVENSDYRRKLFAGETKQKALRIATSKTVLEKTFVIPLKIDLLWSCTVSQEFSDQQVSKPLLPPKNSQRRNNRAY